MEASMKRCFLLAIVLLAALTSAYAQFTFTSLDFPGGTLTTARGINNHGEIVGAYRIVPPRHALLLKAGQYIPLAPNTVLGTNFSEAFKSNDRGDVVGQYIGDDGFSHGFLLSKGLSQRWISPGRARHSLLGSMSRVQSSVIGISSTLTATYSRFTVSNGKTAPLHKSTFLVPWTRPYLVSTHVAISSAGGILALLHQTNTASFVRRGGNASALMFLSREPL